MAALEALGIEVAYDQGDEVYGLCPMHLERVGKVDKKPSWSVNRDSGLTHCLAGDTKVITWDGVRAIRELAGTDARLLSSKGWVVAPVCSYGRRRVWEVVVSRNGVQKTIEATDGHRWFVEVSARGGGRRKTERLTLELKPGDRLTSARLPRSGTLRPSPWGVAHGIVTGDGHRGRYGCRVTLWGEKDAALLKFFPLSPTAVTQTPNGVPGITVWGLPSFFKDRPSLQEPVSYLYGWLAGLFAADGCVDEHGMPTLASSDPGLLEFVRVVCDRVGVFTYGMRSQWRRGFKPGWIHSLSFARSTLSSDFFLCEQHRWRFSQAATVVERHGWSVVSRRETRRVTEVFCAEVPGAHDFALEDHLLTGNCFSCGYSSDFVGLVMDVLKVNSAEAIRWVKRNGLSLDIIETLPGRLDPPGRKKKPERIVPEAVLSEYVQPPLEACQERFITQEACEAYGVLWDAEEGGWILPIRWPDGVLLGWQFKKGIVVLNEPRHMRKRGCLFGVHTVRRESRLILVESPLDCLRLWSEGIVGGVSSFGAFVHEEQVRIITEYADSLVVALDDDAPGQKETKRLCNLLGRQLPTFAFNYAKVEPLPGKKGKDPGDVTRASLYRGIATATHSLEL